MLPITSILMLLPCVRHGVPARRLASARIRFTWMASCSKVPQVIAAGAKPSNSWRSSWPSSQARNSSAVIGWRRALVMARSLAPGVAAPR